MNNYNDSVLSEDIVSAASAFTDSHPEAVKAFSGKTFFITGATGLIGSQIIKVLLKIAEKSSIEIHIAALIRNKSKADEVFYGYCCDSLEYVSGNIDDKIEYEGNIDYIIHGASPTGSKFFVESPVETIKAAVYGTDNILSLAKEKNIESMVYLSSLEVYGVPNSDKMISENDSGYIDPLSVRSSYSEGKRIVECLCASYSSEYSVPVKIARLSQTFGAGVSYSDARVFAEFARAVIEKKDIVLHTEGKTVRSYCYTADAVNAILTILICGNNAEAYNVTNTDTACTISEMAETVASLDKSSGIKVRIEIPENIGSFGYNPEMIIKLDNKKLRSLGWEPATGLSSMFERMIRSMRERKT